MKLEDWKKGKEYTMWVRLNEECDNLNLTGASLLSYQDLGGLYWEPLLELIYKFGNMIKKTGKLKEIKMEWIRPINYLGAQSDIDVYFDEEHYLVPKLATGAATELRFAFQHLIDSIRKVTDLDDTNFLKEYKAFQSDVTRFFKLLYAFLNTKDEDGISGYRHLVENIKLILKPLRMLRKSAYRIFSLERNEQKYQDLLTFQDPKDMDKYIKGVKQYLEAEAYKQQKDCDINDLDKYLGPFLEEEFYKYKFNDKIHVDEPKVEEKDDKGNPKEVKGRKPEKHKSLSAAELEKIKNEEERRQLTFVNIKELKELVPNTFIKEALQKDLEKGFDAMFEFLARKKGKDFPNPIESHKMFVNLNKIPKGREIPQIEFYLGKLHKLIEELKVLCYEMKLNGLSRVLIPIQNNKEFIDLLKKIYDTHNVIDRILGDKLLYEQYLFIYDKIKFINESNMKEDLTVYKSRKFMEENVPKYIFYMAMVHSANLYLKFQEVSRKDGGHFSLDQYYQPLNHEIDGANNIALNAYEMNDLIQKGVSANYKEKARIFWDEVNKYGRFWLMEGYFPPEDRDKWIQAIELLANINRLVQEDIRDMILLGNDIKCRNLTKNYAPHSKHATGKGENDSRVSDASLNFSINTNNDKRKPTKGKRKKTKHTSEKSITKLSNAEKSKHTTERKESLDSTDQILYSLPKNGNGLRPPFVWNFPIERIDEIRDGLKKKKEKVEELVKNKNPVRTNVKKQQKPQLDIVFKEDPKKAEIRKVNAYPYYHDGRTEKFIDLFIELYNNSMKYAHSKGNIWEYVYVKILNVFEIEYFFSHKDENETIAKPAPAEAETKPTEAPKAKEEEKTGEKKEEGGEEKVEEEKKNDEGGEENQKVEENEKVEENQKVEEEPKVEKAEGEEAPKEEEIHEEIKVDS